MCEYPSELRSIPVSATAGSCPLISIPQLLKSAIDPWQADSVFVPQVIDIGMIRKGFISEVVIKINPGSILPFPDPCLCFHRKAHERFNREAHRVYFAETPFELGCNIFDSACMHRFRARFEPFHHMAG